MKRRVPKWMWWVLAAVVVVGAPIAWYLGSPLFINRVVDEALPASPGAAAQGAAIARGTFTGADAFHQGEGTAAVHRIGEDLVLRFDEFKVTNGPDLRVLLAKHPTPKTSADVQGGYLEIAKLKGNVGSQNYTLPADVKLSEYRTVVIYCKPFHAVFATAPLADSK